MGGPGGGSSRDCCGALPLAKVCCCGESIGERRATSPQRYRGGGSPVRCCGCKRRLTAYALRQMYLERAPLEELAKTRRLHELPTARLDGYLRGEGISTAGSMDDVMLRCYAHMGCDSAAVAAPPSPPRSPRRKAASPAHGADIRCVATPQRRRGLAFSSGGGRGEDEASRSTRRRTSA